MFATLGSRTEFFADSIRANLDYWRDLALADELTTVLSEADWSNVARAITFGLGRRETRTAAAELAIDLFDVMDRAARWGRWVPVLARAEAALGGDDALRLRVLLHLGQCLRGAGHHTAALTAHERAEQMALALPDPARQVQVRVDLCEDLRRLHRYAEAEAIGQRALAGLETLPANDRVRLALLNSLGLVFTALGRFEDAEAALREAVGLAERLDNPLFAARILQNLAHNHSAAGQFDEAIATYTRVGALLETSGAGAFDRANLAASLGTLYFWIKDLDMAEAVFKRADPVALRRAGHWALAGLLANNLGNVLQARGRNAEAEAYLREALTAMRDLRDDLECGNVLGVLGEVVAAQGRRAEAEGYWREAIALLEPLTDTVRAQRLLDVPRRNLG